MRFPELMIMWAFGIFFTIGLHAQENTAVFTGVTEPVHDVLLGVNVAGKVHAIHFKEGDWIEEGQVILELEREREKLEMELRESIWNDKAALESAHTRTTRLKELFDSSKRLFEKTRSISEEELTRLELEYLESYYRSLELENQESQEKIRFELAREEFKQLGVIASISGIVTEISVDEGEQCKPGEPVVHLSNPKLCLLVANIEERFARTIQVGQEVGLQIQAGVAFVDKPGTVSFVSPVVDPASGLVKVKVEFDNHDLAIKPGVSGKMLFTP
jgi:RND family efflux transporter MFP subunit